MFGEVICGAETAGSGTAEMTLVSITEVAGKYQSPALRWELMAADGKVARKLTGLEFAADKSAGKFLAELVGHPLGCGDRVILDDLIGLVYEITVSNGQIVRAKPVVKV